LRPTTLLSARLRHVVLLALGFLACASAYPARGANGPPLPAAPIPPQIAAAHKVFISNGGGVSLDDVLHITVAHGGPDRAYDEFYAAMKSWGRYDLVSSPSDADLVLKISFALSDTVFLAKSDVVLGNLRLIILDPKTNVALWTMIEYVPKAALASNRDKNFDRSMDTLVGRFKRLAAPSTAVAAP
jgi:hypothetical protein